MSPDIISVVMIAVSVVSGESPSGLLDGSQRRGHGEELVGASVDDLFLRACCVDCVVRERFDVLHSEAAGARLCASLEAKAALGAASFDVADGPERQCCDHGCGFGAPNSAWHEGYVARGCGRKED